MIALARRLSPATRLNAARASSMSGCSRESQRSPAPALAAIAASGWLISCTIEAAICPIAICWLMRAISARAWRSVLRSVRSRRKPTNNRRSPGTAAIDNSSGNSSPFLRMPDTSARRPSTVARPLAR
jgi:hypothetical protein